ncbi:MAG: hypothetical protein MZU95_14165 [Desulfomicrobium escambiense]|nr:hypothetical protein [Desulfomicrobium escambiense]
MDLPDFNMRLARYAKAAGVEGPLLHRTPGLGMETLPGHALLPVSPTDSPSSSPSRTSFFSSYGVNARYVGHPFVEAEAAGSPGRPPGRPDGSGSCRAAGTTKSANDPAHHDGGETHHMPAGTRTSPGTCPVAAGLDAQIIAGNGAMKTSRLERDLARGGPCHGEIRHLHHWRWRFQGVPEVICYRTSSINYFLAQDLCEDRSYRHAQHHCRQDHRARAHPAKTSPQRTLHGPCC